jgi:hypothetical protein
MAKRMMECIETVIMEDGSQSFTKGKLYRPYKYLLQDGYEFRNVLCAKNDQRERHVLEDKAMEMMDNFLEKHFKEVYV